MEDKKHFTTVDEYIGTFPDNTQIILRRVQKAIRSVLPEAYFPYLPWERAYKYIQ